MRKSQVIILIAIMGCLASRTAYAQSPWETKTYDKFAPEPEGFVPTPGLPDSEQPQAQTPTSTSTVTPPSSGATVSTADAAVNVSKAKSQSSQVKRSMAAASDSAFATTAIQTGTGLLTTSEVASSKTQNPDVKSLADKMVAAYKPIQVGLIDLAKTAKITLVKFAIVPNKETLNKLLATKSDGFDAQYLKDVQRDLSQLHYLFTKQAGSLHNADIKAYVIGKAAVVQKLEDQANKLSQLYPSPSAKAAQQAQQQTQQVQQVRLPPGTIPSFTSPSAQ